MKHIIMICRKVNFHKTTKEPEIFFSLQKFFKRVFTTFAKSYNFIIHIPIKCDFKLKYRTQLFDSFKNEAKLYNKLKLFDKNVTPY